MHAIWRFIQTFGVDVPRPKVMATALAVLLTSLVLGTALAMGWENPAFVDVVRDEFEPGMLELVAYGLNGQSVGCFGIFVLALAWVAAGGAGARIIWLILLAIGATVLVFTLGLIRYLHPAPLTGMVVARGLLCLGLLVGTGLLFAPKVSAWRQQLQQLRQTQREARQARRQAVS